MSSNINLNSEAQTLPALIVPYASNLLEISLASLDGKFKEYTPHSSVPFANLIARTRAAEHISLEATIWVSASASFSGLQAIGGWFPQEIGEPTTMDQILDSPYSVTKTVHCGESVSFPCNFDQMMSRSINYEPTVGARPTFFLATIAFNNAPYVMSRDGGVIQPGPDPKLKSVRIGYRGSVKVSSLTPAIFL